MIKQTPFGRVGKRTAALYTIESGEYSVSVTDFGATAVSLRVPDKNGKPTDVVVGLDSAATLYSPITGIFMETLTMQPGVQVYIADTIRAKHAKGGKNMRFSALCLETQGFPGATEYPYFPSPVIKAGETFTSETVYRFSVR